MIRYEHANGHNALTTLRPVQPVLGGFLSLTRTSETGAPGLPVYVAASKIQYMQREASNAFTWLHLNERQAIRVAETPEEIMEAID